MRCLIAGCGWLGEALGVALARRGDEVWGLRRRPDAMPREIQPIAADLGDASSLAALPARLDTVVFAAAPESGDEASYRRTYVVGLAHLIDALQRGGDSQRPRVVLLSSTSVYGQSTGEWVDESSPTVPADFRGAAVLEAEKEVGGSGFPAVVLRLGGLYGPGRTSLIEAVRAGRVDASGAAPRFTNRIHRDDAVGAILHLLDLPIEAAAGVWVGVDQEPAERDQVLRWLAERLGDQRNETTAASGTPPSDDARGPGGKGGRGGESGRAAGSGRAETNKRCSSARLSASGFRFRYPSYREGYGDLLARR